MFQVSQSKVALWRKCRFAYHLRYVEGLSKRLRDRPLRFGILLHAGHEAIVERRDVVRQLRKTATKERLFAEEIVLQNQEIKTAATILEEYEDYWQDSPLDLVKVEGKLSEHKLETRLNSQIQFVGYVDNFAREGKLRLIVERKSSERLPDQTTKWRDLQTGVYAYLWEQVYGEKPDGVLWDCIRSKEPTRPQVNKSGELSTRDIDSLPCVVRAAIKEAGLKEADYREVIAAQVRNRDNWFKRFKTPTRDRGMQSIFEDFLSTAKEMAQLHGKARERTTGLQCGWCEFEEICRADLTGGDVRSVKERLYDHRTSAR